MSNVLYRDFRIIVFQGKLWFYLYFLIDSSIEIKIIGNYFDFLKHIKHLNHTKKLSQGEM